MRMIGRLGLACLLAACGGGGGGGGSGDGGTGSWLTFTPARLDGVSYTGEPSLTLQLKATSSKTISGPLQLGILIDGKVFASVDVRKVTALEYGGSLHVLSSLPVGLHEGNLEIRLCRDTPTVCSQPYDGSPWFVPFRIDVRSSAGRPTTVENGDFSQGDKNWAAWANEGRLTSSVSGGVYHATIDSAGPQASSMGITYLGGLSVEAGKKYRLSFDARASANRTMVAMVAENGRDLNHDDFPYDDYIIPGPTPSLTTTMTSYQYDFTAPVTDRDASVVFYLGKSGASVDLDNVAVTPL